jgi:serine/threonine protein kinase
MLYRSPEALFVKEEGTPISLAADVWALACVVFEFFAKRTLFECFVPDADDVFTENISLLGKPLRGGGICGKQRAISSARMANGISNLIESLMASTGH